MATTELRVLCQKSGWLAHEGTNMKWDVDASGTLFIEDGNEMQASYAPGCWSTVQTPPYPQDWP